MSSEFLRARAAVAYLAGILPILQSVDEAATSFCNDIDKACATEHLTTEHVERQALKDLCKGVEHLKFDIMAYKVLLGAMQRDARSFHHRRANNSQYHILEIKIEMESFKSALEATQLVFDKDLAGIRQEDTMKPPSNRGSRSAVRFVHDVLKIKVRLGDVHGLIGDLKDATNEIFVCQHNNERVFKPLWYRYVVKLQWTDRTSSVDNIGDIQDRVQLALNSLLGAFRVHPFALSPAKINHVKGPHIFAILNHNHEAVARHQKLARQIGNAWVDDRVPGYIDDSHVQDLGILKSSLFELLWTGLVEHLKRDSPYSPDDPEQPEFEKAVEELERVLKREIVRSRQQRFTIAFCGTVEADKSFFLNALMGLSILPSDEFPSTALPCRLRHVEGRIFPVLQFHAEPFLVALKKLQTHQYGRKMQTYQPPPENMSEALLLSDALSEPSDEEALLRTIHSQWVNLHAVTRDNLLKFETPGFQLPQDSIGDPFVKTTLDQLNDIVRLCQRFDLGFDVSEGNWPLLTVEFSALRGYRMGGIYEFIDLPDIDEGFHRFNSESLVRVLESNSNTIVPIVSLKELPHSDWKQLPALVASGFNRRANVVVCTHLDQVSPENMDEQLKPVKEAFWPSGVLNTNSVIPCSLMGLSARYLIDISKTTKPLFKAIWNKRSLGYHCAAKILGAEDPRATYNRFDIHVWNDKVEAELRASGLPGDIERPTKTMVDSARVNSLLSDVDTVTIQLRGMRIVYERKLLVEATRMETEYEAAKRSCNEAPKISQAVLGALGRVGSMQAQEVRLLLEKKLGKISQRACGLINQTITKTLTDSGMSLEDMDVGHGTRSASSGRRRTMQFGGVQLGNGDISHKSQESSSADARPGNVLVTETRAQAKDFLRLCQRELSSALETLKEECTAIMLDLAGTENAKLLKVVQGMIKQAELQPLPKDLENRISDLGRPSLSIRGLAFEDISGLINARQLSLFNRQYSIEIDTLYDRFKGDIIDPWIRKLKEEGEATLLETTGMSFKAATDWMTSTLLEKELRCKQELEKKEKLDGEERVEHLTAMYSNLLAAEEALMELFAHFEALQI